MHIGYWWECQKERDHWEDRDIGEWAIELYGMDWIDLAKGRDQWGALIEW
jgi:hypothetical protein